MNVARFFLVMAGLSCVLLLGACDSVSPKDTHTYATTLKPLPPDKLSDLKHEFAALNGGNVCSPLNKFGFTEWDLGDCLDRTWTDIGPVDKKDVIERAKTFVLRNAKFTGVTDASQLEARQVHLLGRDAIVDFENQYYDGLEVKNTSLKVAIDGSGVYMVGGNWYPEIFIPKVDKVSRQEARRSLIGEVIRYSDWTGAKTYTISEDSFSEEMEAEKVVLPIKKDNTIVLHVTWKIGVASVHGHPMWYVYVDTTTGERLSKEQMIVF